MFFLSIVPHLPERSEAGGKGLGTLRGDPGLPRDLFVTNDLRCCGPSHHRRLHHHDEPHVRQGLLWTRLVKVSQDCGVLCKVWDRNQRISWDQRCGNGRVPSVHGGGSQEGHVGRPRKNGNKITWILKIFCSGFSHFFLLCNIRIGIWYLFNQH